MTATVSDRLHLDIPPLGTFERVSVVEVATSAGFIPTTHLEKNNALAILAFSGNPSQHPGGLHDHFMEIFDHQRNQYEAGGKSTAQSRLLAGMAVNSVIYTYGDHLANARQSFMGLGKILGILTRVDNPLRKLDSLAPDELGGIASPFNELVRYIDLRSVVEWQKGNREFKNLALDYDPLRTVELRARQANGANKRIEDVYTATERSDVVDAHIQVVLQSTKVGEARKLVTEALDDQVKRGQFFARTLGSVKGQFKQHATEVEAAARIKKEAA